MELVAADRFTLEQLTEAYNQTRVDYMVPMPMNVARLSEYTRIYDVNLQRSRVAMGKSTMLGLGMLGVRRGRAWVTRLGVLPSGRRKGTGRALLDSLVSEAQRQGLSQVWLEVIKGNVPAHALFSSSGFEPTRELIVARRPPRPDADPLPDGLVHRVTALNHEDAIILLSHRQQRPNWLNETETMQNVRNLSALLVELKDGSRGWVAYHAGLLQLTHIVVEVAVGDPVEVTEIVLRVLHLRHTRQDAKAENVPDAEQWLGFQRAGYLDAFRRIEMVKKLDR